MPPPRPPSWIDPLRVPVFGLAWHTLNIGAGRGSSGQHKHTTHYQHIIAYSGGGGSAKTGVHNHVVVQIGNALEEELSISTGEKVGIAVKLYEQRAGADIQLYLLISLGDEVVRYELTSALQGGEAILAGRVALPHFDQGGSLLQDMCEKIAVNEDREPSSAHHQQPNERIMALGCESGLIRLYSIYSRDEDEDNSRFAVPLALCQGHIQPLCAVHFSPQLHCHRLVSSAKDGTARVWNITLQHNNNNNNNTDGNEFKPPTATVQCEATLICDCTDSSSTKKKQKKHPPVKPGTPILVRGCAFGGKDSNVIITVASPKRGAAFLTAWHRNQNNDASNNNNNSTANLGGQFGIAQRTRIADDPVSAMDASNCGGVVVLALGTVDGNIMLWNASLWKMIRKFDSIHELPVTCIAIRPYFDSSSVDAGDDDAVTVHVRSASADSKLACLTLQTKIPKRKQPERLSSSLSSNTVRVLARIHRTIVGILVLWVISPIVQDAKDACGKYWNIDQRLSSSQWQQNLLDMTHCVWDDVLWAPGHEPGIARPPY